jgi:hypothetical protein
MTILSHYQRLELISLQHRYHDNTPSNAIFVGAMEFSLETEHGWRQAIFVIGGYYVRFVIIQIRVNIFSMNEHTLAGWNSSGCITIIINILIYQFILRCLSQTWSNPRWTDRVRVVVAHFVTSRLALNSNF